MNSQWRRRKILIWGKTRPELSQKYREIVCTGGIFENTRRLARLYPIPLRYMDDQSVFKKYQWIEADVRRAPEDSRPESYKIKAENIEIFDTIPTKRGNWDERAKWVLNDENCFSSVEALQDQQKVDRTSLGLVKPKSITGIKAERVPKSAKEGFNRRYEAALLQMELPIDPESGREIRPLTPPDYRFKIEFTCDDRRCNGHSFSVLDWEFDALYFYQKLERGPQIASEKVVKKLNEVCGDQKDTRFFLGNIANYQQTFTIVGTWWPNVQTQFKLDLE